MNGLTQPHRIAARVTPGSRREADGRWPGGLAHRPSQRATSTWAAGAATAVSNTSNTDGGAEVNDGD